MADMRWQVVVRMNPSQREIDLLLASDPLEPDDYGVRYANVHLTTDGHLFALADADSQNALRASLRSMDIPFNTETVHAVWHGCLYRR
jgi:hypothetical protein